MTTLAQFGSAVVALATGSPAQLGVLAVGGAAFAHAGAGLGRARQWYLVPVLFGLVALGGFLLNPFADAHTPRDLQAWLTGPEPLALLCIAQFVLTAAALVFGLRAVAQRRGSAARVWLGVVHVVPAPLVLVAMLMLEQSVLIQSPAARPESVGRLVGFVVAGLGVLLVGLAAVLPDRWLTMLHSLLGLGLLATCVLVPNLGQTLPEPMTRFDAGSLDLCWKVGIALACVVGIGAFCGPRTKLKPKGTKGEPWGS